MSDHHIPDGTDDRGAVALAELDHRGRRAGAALRAAVGARALAERARSNGSGGVPTGPSPAEPDDERATVAVVPAPAEPGPTSREARRPWWLAAAAVVLVAVTGAVLSASSDGRDPVAMSEPDTAEAPSGHASDGDTGPATPDQDRLRAACADGSMSACDELWARTPVDSDLEAYAGTCGGRDPAGGHAGTCRYHFGDESDDSTDEGSAGADLPGQASGSTTTTADMERWRAECADGSMSACDDLWRITPLGTELEAFAATCGGRDPAGRHDGTCEQDFGPGS